MGSNPITRSTTDTNRSWIASQDSTQNLSKEYLLRQKITSTELLSLLSGYFLCAQTEGNDLLKIALDIKPEILIPIYSEKPNLYIIVPLSGTDIGVILPAVGKAIELS